MNDNQDKLPMQEQYTEPQIGIIDMEPEQFILSGSGTVPEMPGESW